MKRRALTGKGFLAALLMSGFLIAVASLAQAVIPVPHTTLPFSCIDGCLQDDPGKFRGMWWGQYLGELKGMRFVSSDPKNLGELYYVKQGDTLELSGVKLEYVQYGFWQGLFSSVAYGTQGEKSWLGLRQACFDNFGRWYQPDKAQEKYYWTGRHSAMVLEYNFATESGQLYVYSKTIYERQLVAARKGGLR